jgi:serine/threonine protein kinase
VLEDLGGEPLTWLMDAPMETGSFLRLAIPMVAALGKVHQRGLMHKDIKPANFLATVPTEGVRLTGFGFASRRPGERQPPATPVSIAGTVMYMAPEQTGRMNRPIDSRRDLYSLGITFYQMLTGSLHSRRPIRWNGCTAMLPGSPLRQTSGWRMCRRPFPGSS